MSTGDDRVQHSRVQPRSVEERDTRVLMVQNYDGPWQLGELLRPGVGYDQYSHAITLVLGAEAAATVGVTITSARELTTMRVYPQQTEPALAPAAYGIAEVTEQMELVPVKPTF